MVFAHFTTKFYYLATREFFAHLPSIVRYLSDIRNGCQPNEDEERKKCIETGNECCVKKVNEARESEKKAKWIGEARKRKKSAEKICWMIRFIIVAILLFD